MIYALLHTPQRSHSKVRFVAVRCDQSHLTTNKFCLFPTSQGPVVAMFGSSVSMGFSYNCTSCPQGYSGNVPNCVAKPCEGTSTAADSGVDGKFYCINGGNIGGTSGSCTCTSCYTGFDGIHCANPHYSYDLTELQNTLGVTSVSKMAGGDSTVVAADTYSCAEGICVSGPMLWVRDLFGEVRCSEDTADCILDGGNEVGLLFVEGTGGDELSIRAIYFKDGNANIGGGMYARDGAIVSLVLCVFSSCQSNDNTHGGGAIYVADATVDLYGTAFTDNVAEVGLGNDIYNLLNLGTITIHDTCPSPYTSNAPNQGKCATCMMTRFVIETLH